MAENIKKNAKFSDYIYVLYKWKKFLFINLLVAAVIFTIMSLLIPNTYKATSVVMAAPDNSASLGGITSLLSGKTSATSISSKLFGVSSSSNDVLFGILNSRTAITAVIKKFDLIRYYEIKDNNMDKAIRDFKSDVSFDPDENGMIEISVVNKDPQVSSLIANYFVQLLDSMNIKLNVEQARNNRIFIEQRYNKNVSDLRAGEDSLYLFQKKYGIIAIPQQLEAAIKASAELEAQLSEKELASNISKQIYGINSPQYSQAQQQVSFLKNKIEELKSSDKLSDLSNVFFPFKEVPEMGLQYYRYFREIEIQTKIMEIMLPMYEQAKVDEQKSIPTIMVIDNAVPPELKYSPKRAFIIIGLLFLSLFLFLPFVFTGEKLIHKETYDNPLQLMGSNLYKRIVKFYKLKL
jgi:uncharacterized protein involved in exopolysaccharide biosynthesis